MPRFESCRGHRGSRRSHPASGSVSGADLRAAVGPLGARFRPGGLSAMARGRGEVGPSRRVGVRCGTAERGPAGRRCRPSPSRRTARSIGVPPARCGPTASCPARAAPSRTPAWPRDRPTSRSRGSVTARAPACVAPRSKPSYREGRQPGPPCEEGNRTEHMMRAPIVGTAHNAEGAPSN